ncbi:MAG: hypothetical protein GX871_02470 [Microbacteriaceae bacterium]|nr:hypothetical protein [Microbacteriaceae bacterium]
MALFQRRKRNDDRGEQPATPSPQDSERERAVAGAADAAGSADDSTAVAPAPAAPAPETATPEVSIGVSVFRGLGAPAGPAMPTAAVAAPVGDTAAELLGSAPAPAATPLTDTPPTAAPGAEQAKPARQRPAASTSPETVAGIRDNVLLREALAALGERPSGTELLNVMRQLMQGHVFLRVPDAAREGLAQGGPMPLAMITDGEGRKFVMLYSSGRALGEAGAQNDGLGNTAMAQPVGHAIRAVLNSGDYQGVVLDQASAPARAVLPRELLQKAFDEADPQARIKSLLQATRTERTPDDVVRAMREAPLWVAINGKAAEGAHAEQRMGIAESRNAQGERFVEVFSHPLEVAALGRGDRALPFPAAQLAHVLHDHAELAGVVIDPGGPYIQLRRDALAPLLVLAGDAEAEAAADTNAEAPDAPGAPPPAESGDAPRE